MPVSQLVPGYSAWEDLKAVLLKTGQGLVGGALSCVSSLFSNRSLDSDLFLFSVASHPASYLMIQHHHVSLVHSLRERLVFFLLDLQIFLSSSITIQHCQSICAADLH